MLKVAAWMMIRQIIFNQLMWYSALATFGLQCRQATFWSANLTWDCLFQAVWLHIQLFNAWLLFKNAVCLLFRPFFWLVYWSWQFCACCWLKYGFQSCLNIRSLDELLCYCKRSYVFKPILFYYAWTCLLLCLCARFAIYFMYAVAGIMPCQAA